MKQVGKFKVYSMGEVLDEALGSVGTPARDEYERCVSEAVHAYRIGETIKKARIEKNLTQEELGERIGACPDFKAGERLQHKPPDHEQGVQGPRSGDSLRRPRSDWQGRPLVILARRLQNRLD